MKHILLIFALLLALTSCENDDLPQSDVQFSVVGKGDSFPNDESVAQRHLIIKDTATWNKLLTEMDAVNNLTKDFKETNIDFSQYQIIVIIDRTQGSGGHSVDVVGITENRNTIIVEIEKLKNGDLTSRLSRPYDIIKIAKTTKKIVFEQ
ncbi:protease complex subunit PrcB family protein [Flavobacterium sp. ACN6]|uniref:protease complex subunit PrcB family protein n=1 Tax=Flavobacterium sp. ACN6 TaxID=1920426 RepID=UPI000BB38063|nr:protease complex subunit PrcB family protein [Flavobacterium sp. ACN6]PBJ12872.1 hypothetical protein BSF42_20530 [Flavobacterium sp. ACN6]